MNVRATIAVLAPAVLLSGCGSSRPSYDTAGKAEAFVRHLESRQCHVAVQRVVCVDRGTVWRCRWSTAGSLGQEFGGMTVTKHPPANALTTVAC